ncbi:MAG: DMT family transporter [Hyphomicrobiaceae bacterium]
MLNHKPLLGIALMIASTALLSTKDGIAKSLLPYISPLQLLTIQFFCTFLIVGLAAAPRYGWRVLRPVPLLGQFIRGALSIVAVIMLYWALIYIPLADGTAMFLLAPIVVTVLSPALLGETLGIRRKIAAIVGFAGVLIILKPGFTGSAVGYYIGVTAGVLMGLFLISNRRLAGSQPPILNVAHNGLMGAVAIAPFIPLFWQNPPAFTLPKLAALVGLAVCGQGLMITSFMFAPAAVLAPYTYTMLVFAVAIGYVAFGTFPDLATWCGMVLIAGAGLYIANRERQLAAKSK